MTGPQIIVLATPVFLLLIAIEVVVGLARGRNTYRLHDALCSIGLGIMSQVTGLFVKLLTVGIYTAVVMQVALFSLSADSIWVWLGALLLYDLCYYWQHRAGHRVALFWAAHVVHHQSEDYNLSTALRQTSTSALLGWIFYLPMAILGIPPLVFATVALVDLLYQYWVHTQQISKLGWFDRWFCSPSNHRVHHAVNDRYLNRNYGGILILWDRLFGTFAEERDSEPCVYGSRSPLRSFDPIWANLEVYLSLGKDAWHAHSWWDKLRLWFMPPEWRPADVAQRFPKPEFRLEVVRKFDPPMSRGAQLLSLATFAGLLIGACALLWNAHQLPMGIRLAVAAAMIAGLWLLGVVSQHGLTRRTMAASA